MEPNCRFITAIIAITASFWLGCQPACADESPTKRASLKTCEVRRAASLLNLGTLLKQGDYTGAKFLLTGLTTMFADCHGVLITKPDAAKLPAASETLASFSARLINKALDTWSPEPAIAELDLVRFKAHTHPKYDLQCAYHVADVARSLESWQQASSVTRALQASLEQAKKDQSRALQKDLTDQLWENMARNDKAAKNYRMQARVCLSVCSPIEPPECHPDS
jgi:hypothetical protein